MCTLQILILLAKRGLRICLLLRKDLVMFVVYFKIHFIEKQESISLNINLISFAFA